MLTDKYQHIKLIKKLLGVMKTNVKSIEGVKAERYIDESYLWNPSDISKKSFIGGHITLTINAELFNKIMELK